MPEGKSSIIPNTLSARLFFLSSLAAVVGVGLAALLISTEYRRNAEARLNDVLVANIFNLMGNVEVGSDGTIEGGPDLGDSRYSLFDSGWYWSVNKIGDNSDRLSSPSLAEREIEVPPDISFDETFQRTFLLDDADGQTLQGLEAQVFLGEGSDIYSFKITASQSILDEEIADFTRTLALILALLAFSIVAATYWMVRFGLEPLRRATGNLAAIRNGEAERIGGTYPDEIQPLIDETNALIETNATIVERARTQVGNLAHSLKTPLAVIQNELSGLPQSKQNILRENTDTMRKQVQLYLDRARISARRSTAVSTTKALPVLEKLGTVIAKLNPDKEIAADLDDLTDVHFAGEEPDLQELCGNLLENAAKYARTKLELNASFADEKITISVEDDGPGMTKRQMEKAQERGGRVDEGKTGWGLGLSIVQDVVDEYDGGFLLGNSKFGGLKATIVLPGFRKT